MRIGLDPGGWVRDADTSQQCNRALEDSAAIQRLMQVECLTNLFFNGVKRIQRGHRLLKDHADIVSADGA